MPGTRWRLRTPLLATDLAPRRSPLPVDLSNIKKADGGQTRR